MATVLPPGAAEANGPPDPAPAAVPDRVCGRCRQTFAGDPNAHPAAQPGWWACATCREALRLGSVVTR